MSNITIKKAKIIKGENLAATYTEDIGKDTNSVNVECSARIHDDLRQSFNALNHHLSALCEQYDADGSRCDAFIVCTGFSIGGAGDNEGVTLSGSRALESGKLLNINSPFEKWESDGDAYGDIDELSQAIERCLSEVTAYLFESKHAPDAQLALEFGSEGNNNDEENEA